jgi:hypothetical protein
LGAIRQIAQIRNRKQQAGQTTGSYLQIPADYTDEVLDPVAIAPGTDLVIHRQ